MYNLFVSGRDDAWEGEPYLLELGRCIREYTDQQLIAGYGNLTAPDINELRALPCIFAYETGCKKAPKFGVLRDVTIRQGKAKIEYDIIQLETFLTVADLDDDLAFELDISKWK